jgi:hypothetical protein
LQQLEAFFLLLVPCWPHRSGFLLLVGVLAKKKARCTCVGGHDGDWAKNEQRHANSQPAVAVAARVFPSPFEWNRLAYTLRWPCIGFFRQYDLSRPIQSRTRPRRVKAQQRVGRRKALVKNHQGAKNITLGVKTMRATRRPLLFND